MELSNKKNLIIAVGVIIAIAGILYFSYFKEAIRQRKEQKEIAKINEVSAVITQALKEENISICDKITENLEREMCQREVILKEAVNKLDPKVCEKFKNDDSARKNCQDRIALGQAVKTKDYKLCDKVVNALLRGQCVREALEAQR